MNVPHTLKSGGVMQLSGRDALTFAQSMFANDITLLHDGGWQWNLHLSAKGRVIALFALVRLNAESLLLWLPDFPVDELAQKLLRMRFRSKLEITPLPDARLDGYFDKPSDLGFSASGSQIDIVRNADATWHRVTLDMSGTDGRTLSITAETGATATAADPLIDARWRMQDIAHGLPRLGPEQVEAFTPQMLRLDRLNAYSVKKGCYPGQEIVARTHFLGQAKRQLVRLGFAPSVDPIHDIQSTALGRIEPVCFVRMDERSEALVVAPSLTVGASFELDGSDIEAHVLPLLDGLERSTKG